MLAGFKKPMSSVHICIPLYPQRVTEDPMSNCTHRAHGAAIHIGLLRTFKDISDVH
jgi:hypothetical protein